MGCIAEIFYFTPIIHISILLELLKMWDTLYLTMCILCFSIANYIMNIRAGLSPVFMFFYYFVIIACTLNIIFLDAIPLSIFPLSAKQITFTITSILFVFGLARSVLIEHSEDIDYEFTIGKTWYLSQISAYTFGTLTIFICKICVTSFIFPRDY